MRVISRPIQPNLNSASIQVNQWKFDLGQSEFFKPLIKTGQCYVDFQPDQGITVSTNGLGQSWNLGVDHRGRFLRLDGTPLKHKGRIVSTKGNPGNPNHDIDFCSTVLGYDGTLPKTRTITEDKEEFFYHFRMAVRFNHPFTMALLTRTNQSGFVTFDNEENNISCPIHRTMKETKKSYLNRRVLLAPHRLLDKVIMATFPSQHGKCIDSFEYADGLFRRDNNGRVTYYVTLKNEQDYYGAAIPGYSLKFWKGNRTEGEVMRAITENNELVGINPFFSIGGNNQVSWDVSSSDSNPKEVVIGAPNELNKKTILGKLTEVTINSSIVKSETDETEARTGYYFPFGRKFWLSQEIMGTNNIQEGQSFEVRSQNKNPMTMQRKEKGVAAPQILFTLDWLWEKGRGYSLDYSSSCEIPKKHTAGVRVIEKTRTTINTAGDYLSLGGKEVPLLNRVPWRTTPITTSVVTVNKRVVFFSETERFSEEEWKTARLIAKAIHGELDQKTDSNTAEKKAAQAKKLKDNSDSDIFDIEGLEKAYILYLKAFHLAPAKDSKYLAEALAIKKLIILRKRHIERAQQYLSWFEETFTSRRTHTKTFGYAMGQYIINDQHNPMSIAYVMATLADLASGKHPGDQKLFERVFSGLPFAMTLETLASRRIIAASRNYLLADTKYNVLPKWIFNHPPGPWQTRALFFNTRRRLGIEANLDYTINWEELNPKPIVSVAPPKVSSIGTTTTVTIPAVQTSQASDYKQLHALYMAMVGKYNHSHKHLVANMATVNIIAQINLRLTSLRSARGTNGSNREIAQLLELKKLIKGFRRRVNSDSI